MFGKLFAYEMKTAWRVYRIMLLLALVLVGPILILNRMSAEITTTIRIFYGLYFLYVVAAGIVSGYYPLFRFYNGLYGKEGYFLHSIPASRVTYLWSKIAALSLWTLIMGLIWVSLSYWSLSGTLRIADPAIWAELKSGFTKEFGGATNFYAPMAAFFLFNAVGGVLTNAYIIVRGATGRLQRLGIGGPIIVYLLLQLIASGVQLAMMFWVPFSLEVNFVDGPLFRLVRTPRFMSLIDITPPVWQIHISIIVTTVFILVFTAWRSTSLFKRRFNINP